SRCRAARPPEMPGAAWTPFTALKTVVSPLPGSPTIVTCIGLASHARSAGRAPAWHALVHALVPGLQVHDVLQQLTGQVVAQVVDEERQPPLSHAVAGPRGVWSDNQVRDAVERRFGREWLVVEDVEHGARDPATLQGAP